MNTINNLEIIESIMTFPDDDGYYYIQILKRKKDNPDLERSMIVLKDVYVYSIEELRRKMPGIIKLCTSENARAYFRVNRRSTKKTAMETLKLTVDYIFSEDYKSVMTAYSKSAGRNHADTDKKWVIDLDDILSENVQETPIYKRIRELVVETGRAFNSTIIPTKNGSHLICPPFNLKKLKDEFEVDVHKDSPTILFCLT